MATIYGGAGDNSIVPVPDVTDLLYGGGGNDTIYGGGSSDTLYGGTENDSLYGGTGADRIYGDDGNDHIYESDFAGGGEDAIYGGLGIDTIDFSSAPSGINLTLADGNAVINPTGGNNTDSLYGFENVVGTASADTIIGDIGPNYLVGGGGADSVNGGAGNDTIEGGTGSDILNGGTGVDTLSYANSATAVNANLDTGTATGEGTDTISNFENLTGSAQADTLTGEEGGNVIDGGAGGDTISAGLGNDTIFGGSGDDVITGGPETAAAGNVPLEFNWSDFGDETTITTGTTVDTGGINVNVTYTAGVANQFTTETGDTIYVAGGEPFSANSSAFLQRPGAGTPTQIQFDFAAISGSNLEGEVSNVQFRISDIDKEAWTDRIIVTAFDADGNPVPVTITELSAELSVTGDTLIATGDNTSQATLEGSALFTIAGPVSRFVITYDNAAVSNQWIYLSDIHFDARVVDDDLIIGGDGNDSILGGIGEDTLVGLADNDTLYGGLGNDQLYGGTGNDVVDGGAGNDTIEFGAGNDTVYGGAGNDLIDDTPSATENGANLIYGGAGNDTISSGNDADTLYGDAGNDNLSGEDGNDVLFGGADNDTVSGGAGNDTLYGDAGNDTLYGDAGQDILYGGVGRDNIYAGDDQDLINVTYTAALNDVLGAESVFGGGGGVDNDTLRVDITGFTWAQIDLVYDPLDNENGTITFFAADGTTVVGTLAFTNIENLQIVCFTTGTRIATDRGQVPVEDLVPGDMVLTLDNGLRPLTWVGKRHVSYAELLARPEFQPVRIGRAALGGAGPDRTMLVSPQHRLLIDGPRAEMYFGEFEVLVPAKHLVGTAEVTMALPAEGVTYVHILFDRHEIVNSDGIWTESFQPATRTLAALEEASRDEVLALFPELATGDEAFPAARLSLKSYESKVLVSG